MKMGIGVLHTVEALNGMLEAGDTVCCTVDCGGGIKAVSTSTFGYWLPVRRQGSVERRRRF